MIASQGWIHAIFVHAIIALAGFTEEEGNSPVGPELMGLPVGAQKLLEMAHGVEYLSEGQC